MEKTSLSEFIHNSNESVIMKAKAVIIRRIAQLLDDYFDGVMKFSPDARIRLDKYDMELDMTTPMYFHPSGLVIDGCKRKDAVGENVVFSYTEVEFNDIDNIKHAYRWTDNLKDLSLSDIQSLLYLVEKEIIRLHTNSGTVPLEETSTKSENKNN